MAIRLRGERERSGVVVLAAGFRRFLTVLFAKGAAT